MFARLFLAFLAVLILACAVFGLFAAQATRERVLEEIERRLRAQAETLKPAVAAHTDPRVLQGILQNLGTEVATRLTVIDGDGRVLADSQADPATMDSHQFRPEVTQARSAGHGQNVRFSDTLQRDMTYYAVLLDPQQPQGVVIRSALPLTRLREGLGSLYQALLWTFLSIGLAGAAVTYLLARWIVHPLDEIRSVADALGSGDFSRKAPLAPSGAVRAVAIAINRMTEELALRLSSLQGETARLQALISSMQEGIVAVDQDGRVIHHNAAAKQLLDIRIDPQGLELPEAIRIPGMAEKIGGVLKDRRATRMQLEIGSRVMGLNICPVGARDGAVLVAHDATQMHRYETLRKEFVANVSHELRTPISLIRGYVETLRDGAWQDVQRAPEFLGIIERHVHRLSAIVEDLLQLSKLESAGQIVKPGDIDVRAFLDGIRDEFRPFAGKKRQELVVHDPEVDSLRADADLLERAVANLIDNAIKYTQEGGRVQVRALRDGAGVAFQVEDNGPGIPEPERVRVFERFYRVDKSRSRDLGGTGLGLAIVKHIAQLHGGSAAVGSAAGSGSVFTLRIPLNPPAASPTAPSARAAGSPPGGRPPSAGHRPPRR